MSPPTKPKPPLSHKNWDVQTLITKLICPTREDLKAMRQAIKHHNARHGHKLYLTLKSTGQGVWHVLGAYYGEEPTGYTTGLGHWLNGFMQGAQLLQG
jgi:hypothetical protein